MANVIRRVVIEELYDNYNYDITFHKDGITLITGPNGFGKTTVLNIIKNALEQNFLYFYELLFKSIVFYFDDYEIGPRLKISKVKVQQDSMFDNDVEYNLNIGFYDGNVKKPIDTLVIDKKFIRHGRSMFGPFLGEDELDFYDEDEYNARRRYFGRSNQEIMKRFRNFQIFLNDKKCLFIKEQRIFSANNLNDANEKYTITQLAEDLKMRYAFQKSRYTDESQKIDSSFVERLLG